MHRHIQFITNPELETPIAEQVKKVIADGCRWVEINMPDASDTEIGALVEEIKPLCIETETFLILTGRAELAKTLNVGGVNLGPHDMLPSQARVLLGAGAVIGVIVSSIEEVESVKALDVDYISIAPFRTEDGNNSLGIDGIKTIVNEMQSRQIEIATVARGGIRHEDIDPILKTGVNGIAVSYLDINPTR